MAAETSENLPPRAPGRSRKSQTLRGSTHVGGVGGDWFEGLAPQAALRHVTSVANCAEDVKTRKVTARGNNLFQFMGGRSILSSGPLKIQRLGEVVRDIVLVKQETSLRFFCNPTLRNTILNARIFVQMTSIRSLGLRYSRPKHLWVRLKTIALCSGLVSSMTCFKGAQILPATVQCTKLFFLQPHQRFGARFIKPANMPRPVVLWFPFGQSANQTK